MAQIFRVPQIWDGKTRATPACFVCATFFGTSKHVRGYAVATLRISKMLSHGLDTRSVAPQKMSQGGLSIPLVRWGACQASGQRNPQGAWHLVRTGVCLYPSALPTAQVPSRLLPNRTKEIRFGGRLGTQNGYQHRNTQMGDRLGAQVHSRTNSKRG